MSSMTTELFDLGALMVVTAGLAFIAKFFKQPLVLAYIAAGFLIGYVNVFNLSDRNVFQVFSDLGIMFLLFLVGLEINYSGLKSVGRVSLVLGVGQVIFTSVFGFFIARFFDFGILPSIYIAVALTFSSTVIILKILSEKRETQSLYGRISVGMLLVQDLIAVLILVFLAGIQSGDGSPFVIALLTLLKAVGLFAFTFFLGRKLLPHAFEKVAESQELLFLISLAWVFIVVAGVKWLGFSIELGGFLAGLSLANSSENFQIAAKIRPLRDFFIVIFFVILGSSAVFTGFQGSVLPVVVLSLFVLIGNPLIVCVIMGIMGYRKRTSFLTGLTVAQISEFSLILMAMGLKLGHVSGAEVALVTLIGVVTIATSTYMMIYADFVFARISRFLSIFERKRFRVREEKMPEAIAKDIILIGCHRVGQSIAFGLSKEDVLVIDFDPETVVELKRHGFQVILGDAADPEIFEKVFFDDAKLVISTSPDLSDNLELLSRLKRRGHKGPKVVLRAESEKDAWVLYDKGADYVIIPHFTAGQYFGRTVTLDPEMSILNRLREKDLVMMKKVAKKI